jgi:DNA polymerase-3 subunit gamma/tau
MTDPDAGQPAADGPGEYRVLARKYRPASFDALIGQDALVRTLTNALRSGRLAHAFMLSGVRGVGKTTTARILARALNCTGHAGGEEPTPEPCGRCEACRAIAEDRHLDVIEMDAASRTRVEEIRELLDGVPYRPTTARYKVYIIDEVHMLSGHSFNALLKTLEEPPEHVKFVFATTELRKVPVTVLSRCQRFDLRRVEAETIAMHLRHISEAESVAVAEDALAMIARAADGSVRDGLSILDQAIALCGTGVDAGSVRDMLGLADRTVTFELFEATMKGDAAAALALLDTRYAAGAEPAAMIEDLLDLTHWITRLKLAPDALSGASVPEAERVRGEAFARGLGMGALSRAWQVLLKGLGETRTAPQPIHAASMVLIRLAYAAHLPTPAEAIESLARQMRDGSGGAGGDGSGHGSGHGSGDGSGRGSQVPSGSAAPVSAAPGSDPPGSDPPGSDPPGSGAPGSGAQASARPGPALRGAAGPGRVHPDLSAPPVAATRALPRPDETPAGGEEPPRHDPRSFDDVIELARVHREAILYGYLAHDVRPVRFEVGRIEINLSAQAPADLPQRLGRFLAGVTQRPWLVSAVEARGEPSLVERRQAAEAARQAEIENHPIIRRILEVFPGATIEAVRLPGPAAPGSAPDPEDDARQDADEDATGTDEPVPGTNEPNSGG